MHGALAESCAVEPVNSAASRSHDELAHSLVEILEGEHVEIGAMIFDVIRQPCSTLGLTASMTVACERRTVRALVLRRPDGSRIDLDLAYVAFVESADQQRGRAESAYGRAARWLTDQIYAATLRASAGEIPPGSETIAVDGTPFSSTATSAA